MILAFENLIHGWNLDLSIDKSVIHGKMMDDFFIGECHPWMKITDKDNE